MYYHVHTGKRLILAFPVCRCWLHCLLNVKPKTLIYTTYKQIDNSSLYVKCSISYFNLNRRQRNSHINGPASFPYWFKRHWIQGEATEVVNWSHIRTLSDSAGSLRVVKGIWKYCSLNVTITKQSNYNLWAVIFVVQKWLNWKADSGVWSYNWRNLEHKSKFILRNIWTELKLHVNHLKLGFKL